MTLDVSDLRANAHEAITRAAEVIGRSKHRRIIFEGIYKGKKKIKSAEELSCLLTVVENIMDRGVRALDAGKSLVADNIVKQTKDKKTGKVAYEKVGFYSKHYKKILSYVDNPNKAKRVPTKQRPAYNAGNNGFINIQLNQDFKIKCKQVTIDDIKTFNKVKKIDSKKVEVIKKRFPEETIKIAFQKIIGERGTFKDWGGEKNDLYTTRMKVFGNRRMVTAIAFKGMATTGKLTPKKMGKHGDQIQRLILESPAKLFLVVYQGEIDQNVIAQMSALSLSIAISTKEIYFGVIDEVDLSRLVVAYPECFD